MHIDIVSDVICPWCFIGKRRLERALKMRPEVDVSMSWRAFQLNPEMPRAGIEGVPCFIVDGGYALSGAQEPEFFLPLFDLAQNRATAAE